jgi:hypothetical protein
MNFEFLADITADITIGKDCMSPGGGRETSVTLPPVLRTITWNQDGISDCRHHPCSCGMAG